MAHSRHNSGVSGKPDLENGWKEKKTINKFSQECILKYPFNEKDPTGKSIQNSLDAAAKDINENYLDKGANAASFDMPQREKDLLNSKGVAGALNGFVSFLPALATAERTLPF